MENKYLIVQWTITTLCQQRCKHCYIPKDSFNKIGLDNQQCLKIIDKLLDYCNDNGKELLLLITGGDPLLRHDIEEIVVYMSKHNIKYIIMGNPYEINKKSVKMLKDNGILEYQLSFDGTELLQDNIRKKGCYSKTQEAIYYLVKEEIPINLMVTVNRDNWLVVEELIYLAEKLNVHSISFGRLVPIGNGCVYSDKILLAEEHQQVVERILRTKLEMIKNGSSLKIIFKEDMLWQLYASDLGIINGDNSNYFRAFKCGIFKTYFAIDFNGDVYPCRRLPLIMGNIFIDTIEKLLNNEVINNLRNMSNHENCNECDLNFCCTGCIAQKYHYTEKRLVKDVHCWKK